MKKVKNRALSAMLIVVAMIVGLGVYIVKYTLDGGKWAAFANISSVRAIGVLTDRNGVVLAGSEDGARRFAESEELRRGTLHAVGDGEGKIGTGALKVFASKLIGYNMITGIYTRTGIGETVVLSIDADISIAAYNALEGRKGAVVIMNYETGEVISMTSNPTYDPQSPSFDEDDPEYEGVYINRSISAAYTPGSIYKLVTTAAALENIEGIEEREYECTGRRIVGESAVTCAKAHGTLRLSEALAESCNIVYAELALEMGAEILEEYTRRYGLIERQTINTIKTAEGRFDKGGAGTAELAWSGVGQNKNEVSPIAAARLAGAIGNGGIAPRMSLLKKTGVVTLGAVVGERMIEKETAERLGDLMEKNVTEKYGADNFPGLEIYAKTGTAEVGAEKEPHAWFIGYIKNEGYPVSFAVIVENGGSGSTVAGAVANKVLQEVISKSN